MEYSKATLSSIYQKFNSSESGISSSAAPQQAELFGINELDKPKKTTFLKRLIMQFKNIMIIILLLSAIISISLACIHKDTQSLFEGLLILAIVVINAIVGVIQEQKAENALASLTKSTEPYSVVVRDGKKQKIKSSELVAGDIIFISRGNRVPADIRLINSNSLKCDESSLTGESLPVIKDADAAATNEHLAQNMLFSGTAITAGRGMGIVVAVGKNTELGKIAHAISTSVKEKTPLEKNIDKIGKVITFGVLAIVVVVFTIQILTKKNIFLLDALLTAVALAVAAIPESLPAVITIIMALGVQKLAKRNAIIKKLNAVETLGSCNIICTDKTGTLTQNHMSTSHVYTSLKTADAKKFNINKSPELMQCAALCSTVTFEGSNIMGDATETAIAKFLMDNNVDINALKKSNIVIKETEFSSARKTMSVLCSAQNTKTLYVKGAIDYILPKCSKVLVAGTVKPLNSILQKRILTENSNICAMGERVIAFACKSVTTSAAPQSKNPQPNQNKDADDLENDLIFIGFFGIIDPPRKEAYTAIKQCHRAGLTPIMITGDHPETAFAIAKSLGLAKHKSEVLTGAKLNEITPRELAKNIHKYRVFARVTPEHKLKIVKAIKSGGNIVAMTGDGVNDAPSIKAADIGVAMGITGTDVTKEVADVIISDDNFSTIVVAIKQGRTIYQNIAKTIMFLLSTNLVEVLGLFVTSLIMPNVTFLSATQILFINLVSDSLPAFALGIEPAEPDIMERPPRNPSKTLLSGKNGWIILYEGFAQTLIVLVMFVICTNAYGSNTANTITFITICIMQLLHAVNCKTEHSLLSINIFKNKFFNISFVALFSLTLAIYFVSPLAAVFNLTQTLTPAMWIIIALTSISIIPLTELGKLIIK